jgi:hypothetical protein
MRVDAAPLKNACRLDYRCRDIKRSFEFEFTLRKTIYEEIGECI